MYKLSYVHEENPSKTEFGGSEFGGYPSLKQRDDSYDIRESMHVHCGYGFLFVDYVNYLNHLFDHKFWHLLVRLL